MSHTLFKKKYLGETQRQQDSQIQDKSWQFSLWHLQLEQELNTS